MEYHWLQAIPPAAWLIPIAIILAAVIGGMFTFRNSSKPRSSTTGSKVRHPRRMAVKVHYGYPGPQVIARLEKLLDEKDIELAERQKTIDQWIERHRDLEQQLAQRPKDDTLAREAKVALDEGKFEEAEALLRRSLESHLKNLETFSGKAGQDAYSLGHLAELQLDYVKAQRYFEQAAVLVPENSTYLNRAGTINHTLGAYDSAVEYFEQALASDLKTVGEDHPNVAIDRNNLGSAYQALGEYRRRFVTMSRRWRVT